ncbi:kinesin-like protein KIF26B [Dipodomys spectabilis]|uniref:kinesin-like protein KIF26B n=1 Tax=Dipodomys spectabilis TaxID=105255 RepID=UPI001C54A607|nr:kinesin-like protein KIF26B [Dipodomys spectabilis]
MHSVAGNKERLAVPGRGKKCGVAEVCSPPKPAAPFSPESWYRRAYEERAGARPAPEGAGSALGSSGTPSPGSGTSSPSSFAGSPGPASPGIGTSSPGSLGGSPGFGTGSPGSGSGGGSSPGSDRGVWCENCNARLEELKRQALRLLLPGPFPGKDPDFSAVVHDKLQVPNTIRKAWNDRDNRCDICATHLNQLKQEAIQIVLTLEQAASSEHFDAAPGSPPPLSPIPVLAGSRHAGSLHQPRDWAFVPAAYAPSNYTGLVNKHNSKPNSLGVSNGLEKKSGSPTHQAKAGLQTATSPNNGNVLNSVAVQAHQYLDGTWSLSRTNGVTLYPYQISQMVTEPGREGQTEAVLNCYNADKPSACSGAAPPASSEAPTGTSVAASFFASPTSLFHAPLSCLRHEARLPLSFLWDSLDSAHKDVTSSWRRAANGGWSRAGACAFTFLRHIHDPLPVFSIGHLKAVTVPTVHLELWHMTHTEMRAASECLFTPTQNLHCDQALPAESCSLWMTFIDAQVAVLRALPAVGCKLGPQQLAEGEARGQHREGPGAGAVWNYCREPLMLPTGISSKVKLKKAYWEEVAAAHVGATAGLLVDSCQALPCMLSAFL